MIDAKKEERKVGIIIIRRKERRIDEEIKKVRKSRLIKLA